MNLDKHALTNMNIINKMHKYDLFWSWNNIDQMCYNLFDRKWWNILVLL